MHRSFKAPSPIQPFGYLTGFEGTHIFGTDTDVLQTTRHDTRFPADFTQMKQDGIGAFRACIPWHTVERTKGTYDWAWVDSYLASTRSHGFTIIADPLHHTSVPAWMEGGFADPEFKDAYMRFLAAFADRYPWITQYTVMNEPFVTTWLAGHCQIWHPYHDGNEQFVPMFMNVCRMISEATEMLKEIVDGLVIVHVDTCERHIGFDDACMAHVEQGNMLRFSVLDLILGRVGPDHPLAAYLKRYGVSDEAIAWFKRNPTTIDVLGLDYYSHSEKAWNAEGEVHEFLAAGFRRTALEYAAHYDYAYPIALTETNLRGTITDRISWLKYMAGECEALSWDLAREGVPFLGFCWYPYIDSTDWCHLVAGNRVCADQACIANMHIDPQGLLWLDRDFERHTSELSHWFALLAQGRATAKDLPAYRFGEAVLDCHHGRKVRNYEPHLNGWEWIEPETVEIKEAA